jgi:hypothetical protein
VKATVAQIGGSTLLIESSISDVEGSPTLGKYGTQRTGVRKDVRNAYDQLKDLVRDIASDMAESLVMDVPNGPKEVSIELGLTFSGGANVWVLTASGEVSCTLSMTWDRPSVNG